MKNFIKDFIIVNSKSFELKKKKFIAGGASSIQVVTDFDRTLTTAYYKGKKTNTAISQIRHNNLLSPDYTKQSYALFDHYHPIEIDPALSERQKIPLMEEWWAKHLGIIVKYGMTRDIESKVVSIQAKYLRKGFKKFFKFLSTKDIPVLVLSSALGGVIEGVLRKHNVFTKNIHVISNFFDFDSTGKAIGYKGKIVHVLNKDESQVKGTPYFEKIALCKNVILMGDSLGDLKMVGQIPYDEILKIGFLCENTDSQLDDFKEKFDVILFGDSSLDFVTSLLKELFP
jgi:5'-nucleotidase